MSRRKRSKPARRKAESRAKRSPKARGVASPSLPSRVAVASPAPAARATALPLAVVAPTRVGASESAAASRFALSVSADKLTLVRLAFFTLVALEALLALPNAARYSAGGFHLAHLASLSELGPGRASFAIAQCAISALAMMTALGAGARAASIALWLTYGWVMFGSQLDPLEHHYLVWLVLGLWALIPSAPGRSAPVPSIAARLVLVQLGVMYLWAAVAKLDAQWRDGTTMSLVLGGEARRWIDATVGVGAASRAVIVAELVLAATVWRARAWRYALPLGAGLHGAIALAGLQSALSCALPVSLYLLLPPEPWVDRVARGGERLRAAVGRQLRWLGGAVVVGGVAASLALRPPFSAWVAAALVTSAAVRFVLARRRAQPWPLRPAFAAAATLALWVATDRLAGVSPDYFRRWAGAARRMGDLAAAEHAYRGLVAVSPTLEVGHYHLGRLLVERGALDEGLRSLQRAERADPRSARAIVEQARVLTAAGRTKEAAEAAQRARRREATFGAAPGEDEL